MFPSDGRQHQLNSFRIVRILLYWFTDSRFLLRSAFAVAEYRPFLVTARRINSISVSVSSAALRAPESLSGGLIEQLPRTRFLVLYSKKSAAGELHRGIIIYSLQYGIKIMLPRPPFETEVLGLSGH